MNINRAKTQQTGSVLLEALIAILIFSIGILALIGMQATAINNVADAKYRSTAGFLADQIVGTIWANRLASVGAAASNVAAATADPGFCLPVACAGGSAGAAALAAAWAANDVAANLPQGTGTISMVGPTVTVTVGWLPPKEAAAGAPPHRHVVSAYID